MPEEKMNMEETEVCREEGHLTEVPPKQETAEGSVQKEERIEESAHKEEYIRENVPKEEHIEEKAQKKYISEAMEDSMWEPESFREKPRKRSFFNRNKEEQFSRDKWILSRIRDEDLMEYLILEQKRNEQLQEARDIREKRIISAFMLTVSLAAGVGVVYLLKDNPIIFVNILYIGGLLGGLWFWKNHREK